MLNVNLPIRPGLLITETPDTPADRVAEKRRIRKHQVLDIIRRQGPVPRVEIARTLGFNLPSVSSLVDELVSEGLASEDKAKRTPIGRRPIPVSFNPEAASIIGIDVGKTSTIGLLMDLGGAILGRLERPSPTPLDLGAMKEWLSQFVNDLVETQTAQMPPLAGVGIGLPGLLYQPNVQARLLQLSPPVEEVRNHLGALLGVPVIIDNDSHMMAYGVLRFGNVSSSAHDNMAIVNLGFGLGLGLVVNGTIYQGYHGHASELGHLPLGEHGVPCYCGGQMCLENTASGSGLERMASRVGLNIEGRPVNSAELAEMARQGSPEARQLFERFASALALGVATLINLMNPQAVVLAGRVARSADLFQDALFAELPKVTHPLMYQETQIIVSDLYENAGPLGACACVLHHIFSSSHITVKSIV